MNHRLGNQLTAPLPACLSHSDYPRLVSSSHRMGEGRWHGAEPENVVRKGEQDKLRRARTTMTMPGDRRRGTAKIGKCCRRSSPDSRSGLRLCSKQFVQPRQVYVADQSLLTDYASAVQAPTHCSTIRQLPHFRFHRLGRSRHDWNPPTQQLRVSMESSICG